MDAMPKQACLLFSSRSSPVGGVTRYEDAWLGSGFPHDPTEVTKRGFSQSDSDPNEVILLQLHSLLERAQKVY